MTLWTCVWQLSVGRVRVLSPGLRSEAGLVITRLSAFDRLILDLLLQVLAVDWVVLELRASVGLFNADLRLELFVVDLVGQRLSATTGDGCPEAVEGIPHRTALSVDSVAEYLTSTQTERTFPLLGHFSPAIVEIGFSCVETPIDLVVCYGPTHTLMGHNDCDDR